MEKTEIAVVPLKDYPQGQVEVIIDKLAGVVRVFLTKIKSAATS